MKNCRGRATAWKVSSFWPGVPKPSTCWTIASPRRGSIAPMWSIMSVRNWCSTNSFWGSAWRATQVAEPGRDPVDLAGADRADPGAGHAVPAHPPLRVEGEAH